MWSPRTKQWKLLVETAKVLLGPPSRRYLRFPILHVASELDTAGEWAGLYGLRSLCGLSNGREEAKSLRDNVPT